MSDESRGTYNVNSQIKFKTTVLKSSLCDYSDAYIRPKGNVTVNNQQLQVLIQIIQIAYTNCISQINNTQIDNAKDTDIVMSMYNLIEYSDNYSKTSGSVWQYCKDIPAVNNNGNIVEFNGANATDSFNFKAKITGQTNNNGRIDHVEIMVPLKYLSNFRRTLEIPLINCEINLTLTWFAKLCYNLY